MAKTIKKKCGCIVIEFTPINRMVKSFCKKCKYLSKKGEEDFLKNLKSMEIKK